MRVLGLAQVETYTQIGRERQTDGRRRTESQYERSWLTYNWMPATSLSASEASVDNLIILLWVVEH